MKLMIKIKGQLYDLSTPKIMGILNITPDSFYVTSRTLDDNEILKKTEQMINEGVDIIDIGACSTRPGSSFVDEDIEIRRLKTALNGIKKEFPEIIISVDTFRASVARWCISEYEVDIINDISGGAIDKNMYSTIADLQVPYILMHMRGTPQNMQQNVNYSNVTQEIIYELSEKVYLARETGINDIIIDPGFGFAKTLEQNYEILSNLESLHIFKLPILVGVSRKSMIYKLLNSDPTDALNGTTVLNTIALLKGANILRVHDVKPAKEVVKIIETIKSQPSINR